MLIPLVLNELLDRRLIVAFNIASAFPASLLKAQLSCLCEACLTPEITGAQAALMIEGLLIARPVDRLVRRCAIALAASAQRMLSASHLHSTLKELAESYHSTLIGLQERERRHTTSPPFKFSPAAQHLTPELTGRENMEPSIRVLRMKAVLFPLRLNDVLCDSAADSRARLPQVSRIHSTRMLTTGAKSPNFITTQVAREATLNSTTVSR